VQKYCVYIQGDRGPRLFHTQGFEAESGSDADPVRWGSRITSHNIPEIRATDSTKDSKQKETTEKAGAEVESQILGLSASGAFSGRVQEIERIILRCGPIFGRGHTRSLTKIQLASKL
jgi:hypothetical protein